jgi:hypothetical protein
MAARGSDCAAAGGVTSEPSTTASASFNGSVQAEARASYDAAADAVGAQTRDLQIADRALRLRIAGGDLQRRLGPSFAHLGSAGDAVPALTVSVWESNESGAPPPVPLPVPSDEDPEDARVQFDDGSLRVTCWPRQRVMAGFDRATREAWWWIADARDLAWWEAAAPLRILLHWWAVAEGCRLIHAGAVGLDRSGALIVGRSGSGKSTLSLACLQSQRLRFVGDDYVWLEDGAPPRAHTLYATAKVVPGGEWRVPHVRARRAESGDDAKMVVDVHEQYPDRIAVAVPVDVVLMPRITGGPPRVSAAHPADVFRALAASTVLQLPDAAAAGTLATIRRLLETTETCHLDLGDDLDAAVRLVEELLADR